jgi:hypothetical protein
VRKSVFFTVFAGLRCPAAFRSLRSENLFPGRQG